MVETPADGESRVLMEWSLQEGTDGDDSDRRIRAIRHDGEEGAWKTVLETRLHTDLWAENATIGYADSLEEVGPVEPYC